MKTQKSRTLQTARRDACGVCNCVCIETGIDKGAGALCQRESFDKRCHTNKEIPNRVQTSPTLLPTYVELGTHFQIFQ